MMRCLLGLLPVSICALSLTPIQGAAAQTSTSPASDWTQWGGPTRDFHSPSTGLADAWPASGPPVLWTRPLGTGHSAIVVDDGRLFTMYRTGNGRTKQGPWKQEEVVAALDAKTGATIWEHTYPARQEDFSFGAGPHATPLVVGDRVFTTGTNQQLFAFDKRTGRVLWSHDFIKEFKSPELLIRPTVKVGYGCSPIAFRDTIICSVGGPGQAIMAFRQSDGGVAWKSGDFLTASAAPILIQMAGRPQVVFFAGGTVTGLDPANGAILWSHPHDPGNDLNCGTPLFGADNVLFVSSAYQAGSRAIQLTQHGDVTDVDELWFTNRVRFMFLSSIRIGDFVYGTTGDFGPAFLTALDIKTGQSAWQVRGFARASLLQADGKVIVMNEDGDLALAKLTPTGAQILSRAKIFDTTSWTAPTLSGTTLYARDREKIVALDLGAPGGAAVRSADRTPVREDDGRTTNQSALRIVAPPTVFAGSWKLDTAASTVADGASFAGVTAAGAPPWLFVTQPANGTLVVESPVNTGHARFYRPGQSTTTETKDGTITMSPAWAGKTLVAEGSARASGGAVVAVKETLSRDGEALVIEIVAAGKTSRLRYSRLLDVGPCESWPTPCKRTVGIPTPLSTPQSDPKLPAGAQRSRPSLLVVMALPRYAQAQASRPQELTREVFVNFGAGRVFRLEDRSFGTGLDLGGGFAVRKARLGVEFGVSRLSGFAQLLSPCAFPGCQGLSLSSATLASANVLYYLVGTRVQPYVTGGAGGFWSRATDSVVTVVGNVPTLTIVEDRDAGVSLNVGGGLRIAAGSRFSLRPDVRFYDTSIRSRQNLSLVRTSLSAAFSW